MEQAAPNHLPHFNNSGLLPPGDYPLTIAELHRSQLVTGPRRSSNWDEPWRSQLVKNLALLAEQLWSVGIEEIFIDGSFLEEKDHPNDIDGYYVCEPERIGSGELENALNALDPHRCWTWDFASRRPYPGFAKWQLPMWHAYRVELFPHYGQLSGIRDEYGHELEFPAAFRKRRDSYEPKGIVRLLKEKK